MEGYRTPLEYILAELERIDLLIQASVEHARQIQHSDPDLQGLYISEEEVDQLLVRPVAQPFQASDVMKAMNDLEARIAKRKRDGAEGEDLDRLDRLVHLFQLSTFDRDALLICLAPEVGLRYERLYAYLQDDVTKKRPGIDLILNLLSESPEARLANRQRFTPSAPLIKYNLLQLHEDPAQAPAPLIGKSLKIDERIVNFLLNSDDIDPHLMGCARLIVPRITLEQLTMPNDQKQRLQRLSEPGSIFYFHGPGGVGKLSTAEALCGQRGLKLLDVSGDHIHNLDLVAFTALVHRLIRESRLQNAALCWKNFDHFLDEERRAYRFVLLQALEEQPLLAFLTGEVLWESDSMLEQARFARIEFKKQEFTERVQLWSQYTDLPAADVSALANKFRFSAGQIQAAATTARNIARTRDPESPMISLADIYAACRLHSNQKLSRLAQKITTRYQWTDIILPEDRLEQLREICDHVRYRVRVYQEWGFDGKLSLGKGLNVLFAGPSGTGKTMAAEIIAGELGLELYKIDLSMVVSKYIGETEKNLARIFEEAETSNAILFFDEADALFGKRSEVRDAHDRYANIEIAYLLQKMEEYDGVVILATNLRRNMDEAFLRRMHFAMEFPFPTEHDRERIWENIWPKETPLHPGLDLCFMARRFEIAGGNIRNVALAAAFFAANDGRSVQMAHLIRAIKREYQKMGKVVMDGEFGEHATLETA